VERALGVLDAFRHGDDALALAELARRTGLYKSTILRLIASLERYGYLRQLADGRYALGPAPARLAQVYQHSFRIGNVVLPELEQLSRKSGETASFYVRDGNGRVCLHRIEPVRAVRYIVREGDRFPLDRGASGKVLRAFGPRPDRQQAQVRERMWAASFGERDPEAASVAAPVFGMGQELKGALAISGPRERFTPERVAEFARLLLAAAPRVSSALGGDPSVFSARGVRRAA